LLWRG